VKLLLYENKQTLSVRGNPQLRDPSITVPNPKNSRALY